MVREKEQGPDDIGPPWTALKLLRWTAEYFEDENISETPRLDADLLLADVLDLERVELYARFDTVVEDSDRAAFRALVKRRAEGEPVAYLVGRKSFWQLELAVDERALIPRPETEVLVEEALDHLPEDEPLSVVDIGTGAGAVALALADERPTYEIAATDFSQGAVELTRENVERLGFEEHIEVFHGDLFEALPDDWGPLDAVVSNPPYVPAGEQDDLAVDIRKHEPDEALFGGPDGLEIVERLVSRAAEELVDEGWLFIEIGAHQGSAVAERVEEAGFEAVGIRQDYADRDRVVRGRAPR